jgi:hypothetical protein
MAERRRRSISAKVTDAEYARLVTEAGDQTISAWLRTVALEASSRARLEALLIHVLAEQLATRTILINAQFASGRGQPLTTEAMQQLIDRADREKFHRAHERVTPTSGGRKPC